MSCIYALRDPNTNEIRYIGKATDKKARLYLHIKEGLYGSSTKDLWLNSLLRNFQLPIVEVIETPDKSELCDRGKYWIDYYSALGANLTNEKNNPGWQNHRKNKTVVNKSLIENLYLPEKTLYQLFDLMEAYHDTQSSILVRAIDAMKQADALTNYGKDDVA